MCEFVTIDISTPSGQQVLVELPEFPDGALDEFDSILGFEVKRGSALHSRLRLLYSTYSSNRNVAGMSVRSAQRERQRNAAHAVRKALEATDQLTLDDVVPMILAGGEDGYDRLRALSRLLEHWTPIMEKVADERLLRGREINQALEQICGHLKFIFEEETKQTATLSTWKNAQYAGAPTSRFGRFVAAFFKYVDPCITPKDLVEPLKRTVWPSGKSHV